MRERGLCCLPVSVRPSVTFMYCIQTAEDIVKLLSRPSIYIILVLCPPQPLQLVRKIDEGGKICDFRLKSLFISETVRDRMVATEH